MRSSIRLPTGLAIVTVSGCLLLGCSDLRTATDPDPGYSPALSVERTTVGFAFVFVHFPSNQTVQVGTTLENMVAFCPGLIPATDSYEMLTVTRPDGSMKATFKGRDVHVIVWRVADNPCNLLQTPHLTGTARFIAPDSDVDLTGHGADATNSLLIGTVTDETGQEWHLVLSFHGTVEPGMTLDDYVLVNHVEKIQLTPVGR